MFWLFLYNTIINVYYIYLCIFALFVFFKPLSPQLIRLDIDLTDHNNEINNRKAQLVQQQQQAQVKQQLGNKVIAGLMPNPAAQAYASIAHAAAASAQNRNNAGGYQNTDQLNQSSSTNMGSSNNLINTSSGGNGANNMPNNSNLLTQNNSLHTKSQTSYNNPGFFESASYSNVFKL